MLEACNAFKTLDEHVQAFNRSRNQNRHFETVTSELKHVLPPWLVKLWKVLLKLTPRLSVEPGQDLKSLTQQLRDLAKAGFLISEAELLKASLPIEAPVVDPRISTVGIVTCNKEDTLRRCLVTYLENNEKFQRFPEFIVMDDSTSLNKRTKTREMLASLKDLPSPCKLGRLSACSCAPS